jgi:hypothetical protein
MKEIIEQSAYYRGMILHQISDMEFIMNTVISFHYCGKNYDKSLEMQTVILGDERVTLSSKSQILFFILTTHHKDFYSSYKSLRIHDPKKKPYSLSSDLSWVIEERNVFAHRILDRDFFITGEQNKDGYVRFVRFKNEITGIEYDDKKFDLLFNSIIHISTYLNELIKKFKDI